MSMCDCNQGRLPCTCKTVPPVVEVLGYSVKGNRYAIRLTKGELLDLSENYTGTVLIELVDRAHLTRLQAEVERLQDQLADAKATANLATTNLEEFKEDHQSELTKARELLRSARASVATHNTSNWSSRLLQGIDAYLSNQSAPADKGL